MNRIELKKIKIGTVVNQSLELPILSVGKGGQTIGIVAGIHGNEPESLFIIRELLARLHGIALDKKVKILPGANPFGLMNNTREAAFDALDLNRSFPGKADGTLTERIAHAIFQEFSSCQIVIDIHSIVNHGNYMGAEIITKGPLLDNLADLNRLLAPPAIWRAIEGDKFNPTLDSTLLAAGVSATFIEVPRLEYLNKETMDMIVEGLLRIIKNTGPVAPLKKPIPVIANERRYFSDYGGIYTPVAKPMDTVSKNQLIGIITDLQDFKDRPLMSKWSGVLTVQSSRKVLKTGDKVYVVGEKIAEFQ
jgi:predicted deacylase